MNGTRCTVDRMSPNVIEVILMNGPAAGKHALIPRIPLIVLYHPTVTCHSSSVDYNFPYCHDNKQSTGTDVQHNRTRSAFACFLTRNVVCCGIKSWIKSWINIKAARPCLRQENEERCFKKCDAADDRRDPFVTKLTPQKL